MTDRQDFYAHLRHELQGIRDAGLFKQERVIATPQGAHIRTVASDGTMREVLNLCANNYLGLSSHPDVVAAAILQEVITARLTDTVREELGDSYSPFARVQISSGGTPKAWPGFQVSQTSSPGRRSSGSTSRFCS